VAVVSRRDRRRQSTFIPFLAFIVMEETAVIRRRSPRRVRTHVRGRAHARIMGTCVTTVAAVLVMLGASMVHADAPRPGDAQFAPVPSESQSRTPSTVSTEVEAEGLYSYTTPFAPPRWLRVQQAGTLIWGTIDINDAFGMCTRARFDGTLSGTDIEFEVPLLEANCPCSGSGAMLRFTGTVDSFGNISGIWENNCMPPPPGPWWACSVPEGPAGVPVEGEEECVLPDNQPPDKVRQTPGGGTWSWMLLAGALTFFAGGLLRRARLVRERA
jgi:hypothetical protein